MKTRKKGLWVLPLAALLAGIFFLSFLIGRYRVPALQVLRLLTDRFLSLISFGRWGLAPTWTAEEASVVVQIRLPRILSAALIGAALSAAGTSYQAMFRNPMVSPDLLGASTGACFGAALAILLGASYAVITASSFLFGLAAVGLTYLVGRLSRIRSTLAMVLAGMMVGSLFSAGTSFIKLVADTTDQLPAITYWLMGALTSVRLDDLHFAMVPILCGLIPLFFLRWRLNLLSVSEAEARSMGVNTRLLRLLVIICDFNSKFNFLLCGKKRNSADFLKINLNRIIHCSTVIYGNGICCVCLLRKVNLKRNSIQRLRRKVIYNADVICVDKVVKSFQFVYSKVKLNVKIINFLCGEVTRRLSLFNKFFEDVLLFFLIGGSYFSLVHN